MVKDEADVLAFTLAHLKTQVDHVIVSDNGSTDGSQGVAIAAGVERIDDPELGYWQSKRTTALAMHALDLGYDWVLPCDADEYWYANDGRPIRDFLDGLSPDVQIVEAPLWHHIPTALDLEATQMPSPFKRIGWRKREHGALPKVACRLRPDLVIEAGNHGASTEGTALRSSGLAVRHYSWRSPEQFSRKIANGARAYAATDLPENVGSHWRSFGDPDEHNFEARTQEWFRRWFWSADPHADSSLVFDPVEVADPPADDNAEGERNGPGRAIPGVAAGAPEGAADDGA